MIPTPAQTAALAAKKEAWAIFFDAKLDFYGVTHADDAAAQAAFDVMDNALLDAYAADKAAEAAFATPAEEK